MELSSPTYTVIENCYTNTTKAAHRLERGKNFSSEG